jgi:hypothetical protein
MKTVKGAGPYSNLNDGLNFSKTALEHMEKNGRQIPIQTLQDFIRNGETFPAPSGSSATRYYTTITRSGKLYNLKVLYHSTTNQIYQFEYARKAMGKLPKIKK